MQVAGQRIDNKVNIIVPEKRPVIVIHRASKKRLRLGPALLQAVHHSHHAEALPVGQEILPVDIQPAASLSQDGNIDRLHHDPSFFIGAFARYRHFFSASMHSWLAARPPLENW